MKVAIGSDHGGFGLKEALVAFVLSRGHEVTDVGAFFMDRDDDYPDYTRLVAEMILKAEAERGIVVCGSGVGASIAASKFPGIRAAVCHDAYSAHQGVEHDDMNVLCLGQAIIGEESAKEIVSNFLKAHFMDEARYVRRLQKVRAIEREFMKP